jgi:uncharacterized membrane protein|tara:strand:- start:1988 stop:2392 length:405 start_codon:yes stop_codon:yes gene_type:complete
MKILLASLFFTSLIFLIIDIIWLSYAVKSFYRPNIGPLLNDKPVMWAAIMFYLVYVIGLSIIILQPSLSNNSISQAFWTGLVFGVVAYGTYNLTNMATIKNWSVNVVIVDMIWGGILTGFSSSSGIYLAKKFFN